MLEGKIALVTGAAKGIGRAIALALAAEKATVIVNYNGSAEKAEQTLEEIRALGADGRTCQCNVADTQAALAMIKEVTAEYGRLDILVNNAGICPRASAMEYTKAGIIGLTKTMARELASRGITVNAVAPGFVDTDMTQALPDGVKEAAVAQIPLGRFGKPEDIADMVAYLASEKAAYITGQIISVDGGMAI